MPYIIQCRQHRHLAVGTRCSTDVISLRVEEGLEARPTFHHPQTSHAAPWCKSCFCQQKFSKLSSVIFFGGGEGLFPLIKFRNDRVSNTLRQGDCHNGRTRQSARRSRSCSGLAAMQNPGTIFPCATQLAAGSPQQKVYKVASGSKMQHRQWNPLAFIKPLMAALTSPSSSVTVCVSSLAACGDSYTMAGCRNPRVKQTEI